MNSDDRDLHEAFATLRREEEAQVPIFSLAFEAERNQRRRRLPGKLIAWSATVAATIAIALWMLPGSRAPYQEHARIQTASITTWKPPTDFLLNTPGRELLQDVPAIGAWDSAATAAEPRAKHGHLKKKVLN